MLSMLSKILPHCHCVWRHRSFSSPYQSWHKIKIVLRIDRKRTRESFFICFFLPFRFYDSTEAHTQLHETRLNRKTNTFFFLLRISPLHYRMWEEEVFVWMKKNSKLKTRIKFSFLSSFYSFVLIIFYVYSSVFVEISDFVEIFSLPSLRANNRRIDTRETIHPIQSVCCSVLLFLFGSFGCWWRFRYVAMLRYDEISILWLTFLSSSFLLSLFLLMIIFHINIISIHPISIPPPLYSSSSLARPMHHNHITTVTINNNLNSFIAFRVRNWTASIHNHHHISKHSRMTFQKWHRHSATLWTTCRLISIYSRWIMSSCSRDIIKSHSSIARAPTKDVRPTLVVRRKLELIETFRPGLNVIDTNETLTIFLPLPCYWTLVCLRCRYNVDSSTPQLVRQLGLIERRRDKLCSKKLQLRVIAQQLFNLRESWLEFIRLQWFH